MTILEEAKQLRETIIQHRRHLHAHAELAFELPATISYVEEQLKKMGYEPQRLGESGIVALAGGKLPGKTFLLRADMDALPFQEVGDMPFCSKTGNMHACGHDFHTAMLLGAAQILKKHELEIKGTVKMMFQPAEEILSGAKMMIANGVLENPTVDAAMMLHVLLGKPLPAGSIQFPGLRGGYAAADAFVIEVTGKGCHGAMPDKGVDPLSVLAHIHLALQELNSREVSPFDVVALTVGEMHGGNTSNSIPETAYLSGTLRTRDNKVRAFAKQRLQDIAMGIAQAFRATAEVTFKLECPSFEIDADVYRKVKETALTLFGPELVTDMANAPTEVHGLASDDFAYVSVEVPTITLALSAGSTEAGYTYPLHHPRARFDEKALPYGTAIYAAAAMEWLEAND